MTERILQAADRLFYTRGIRAVGVDTIAAEAGISKRSLYDTFPSKEALIEAYLTRRIQPSPASDLPPAEQIMALFDHLHARFTGGDFRGCPFVNAVTELGEDCEAARNIAARFKQSRRDRIQDLLTQAGAADPGGLADQIALLIEGAIATMLVHGDADAALTAGRAARTLLVSVGISVPIERT